MVRYFFYFELLNIFLFVPREHFTLPQLVISGSGSGLMGILWGTQITIEEWATFIQHTTHIRWVFSLEFCWITVFIYERIFSKTKIAFLKICIQCLTFYLCPNTNSCVNFVYGLPGFSCYTTSTLRYVCG